jgi:hypothetical protein
VHDVFSSGYRSGRDRLFYGVLKSLYFISHILICQALVVKDYKGAAIFGPCSSGVSALGTSSGGQVIRGGRGIFSFFLDTDGISYYIGI